MIGLAVPCFAENSKVEVRGTVDDGDEVVSSSGLITKYFSTGVVQVQTLSIDGNTHTTITVPSGAKAVLIDVISSDGLQLKGVSTDRGISLDDTTPVLLPLSTDSTIVINSLEANGNRIRLFWF